ncbi:MAG: hypothetical protein KIT25_13800 [Enhydrobacter sp.]|nr:MAG: hypothetical protein KIT25_13800 [Enhydrobacter sp.]
MNPFSVQTPEGIAAQTAVSLFVSEVPGYSAMVAPGHTFLHGARGSGKSMLFRYLEPDCQALAHNYKTKDLPFLGVYVPIKGTDIALAEFERIEERHADVILNEHFFSLTVLLTIIHTLLDRMPEDFANARASKRDVQEFYVGAFGSLLQRSFWQGSLPGLENPQRLRSLLLGVRHVLRDMHAHTLRYVRSLFLPTSTIPYDGPLAGFLDFVVPFITSLRTLSALPNSPVYLLIDDADNLSNIQTRVLNNWVSIRSTENVCLKISTQLQYKTFSTTHGQRIESPHDFQEFSISDVYTTDVRDSYRSRVRSIVEKRLKVSNIQRSAERYFPPDQEQEDQINHLANTLRSQWQNKGKRGNRARDDAYRYARPDYIKGLGGAAKSKSTYSYAGFDQLVHVSSGIVRFFLHAATKMHDRASTDGKEHAFIPPHIQNEVVRELANDMLFSEFDKIRLEEKELERTKDRSDERLQLDVVQRLSNLVNGLGSLFHAVLLSERSERRVFSIAFQDEPSPEVREVLNLGMRYGYFHRSSIGRKEGIGRAELYILSRQLAPAFQLDPTGFAGYLFVTNSFVKELMKDPRSFPRRLKEKGLEKLEEEVLQADLFAT